MRSLFKKSPRSNFGSLLNLFSEDGISLSLVGVFNIESGHMSVRSERFNEVTQDYTGAFRQCNECAPQEEGRLFFSTCDICGKNESNYFWIPAGDGDGIYTAFELLNKDPESGEVQTRGFLTVLFPTNDFAEPIVEHALKEAESSDFPLYAFSFSTGILDPHNELEAFEVTKLEGSDDGWALYLSDVTTSIDSDNAIVSLHLNKSDEITIFSFSEEPGPTQIAPKPRIVLGYSSEWLKDKGFKVSMEKPYSRRVFDEWVLTGFQFCHLETMGDVATWFNFKINEAMEKYNYAASWLLQGALHGDSSCIKELDRYEEYTSDPEWIVTWLGQRKQYQAADDYSDGRLTFPFYKSVDRSTQEDTQISSDTSGEKPEMVQLPTWGSFRDFWVNCELTITPRLLGFIDIEGGHIGISGEWIESCGICFLETSCAECGRNSSNFLHLRAGNGDGVYSAFELSFDEKTVGSFLILDDFGYAPALMERISEASEKLEEDPKVLEDFYVEFYENFYESIGYLDPSLQMYFFGEIEANENAIYSRDGEPAGIMIFGESGEGKDSKQSLVTSNNIDSGKYRIFVFALRDEDNNNILVPRSVLILEETAAEEIGLIRDFAKSVNLHDEYNLWNESTVFARIGEPLAPYAISANKDWSDLKFAREMRIENFESARDIRMEWLSWLLMLQYYIPSTEVQELIWEVATNIEIPLSTIRAARGQFKSDLLNGAIDDSSYSDQRNIVEAENTAEEEIADLNGYGYWKWIELLDAFVSGDEEDLEEFEESYPRTLEIFENLREFELFEIWAEWASNLEFGRGCEETQSDFLSGLDREEEIEDENGVSYLSGEDLPDWETWQRLSVQEEYLPSSDDDRYVFNIEGGVCAISGKAPQLFLESDVETESELLVDTSGIDCHLHETSDECYQNKCEASLITIGSGLGDGYYRAVAFNNRSGDIECVMTYFSYNWEHVESKLILGEGTIGTKDDGTLVGNLEDQIPIYLGEIKSDGSLNFGDRWAWSEAGRRDDYKVASIEVPVDEYLVLGWIDALTFDPDDIRVFIVGLYRGEMKQYFLNLMEEFPVMKTFADEHLDFARNLGPGI